MSKRVYSHCILAERSKVEGIAGSSLARPARDWGPFYLTFADIRLSRPCLWQHKSFKDAVSKLDWLCVKLTHTHTCQCSFTGQSSGE